MADLLRDFASEIVFQLQNVLDSAVVAFRPNVLVRGGANQLNANAHAVVDALNGAFNNAIYMKFVCNFRRLLDGALIADDRRAGDHLERADFGELGDQLVGETVGKILLRGIGRKIDQGQNGDGMDGVCRRSGREPLGAKPGDSRDREQNADDDEQDDGAGDREPRELRATMEWFLNGRRSGYRSRGDRFRRFADDLASWSGEAVAAFRHRFYVVCPVVFIVQHPP